jgi:hypothetical protein
MIVDDHAVVRDDLRAPMAQQAELEVRGLPPTESRRCRWPENAKPTSF